MHRNHIDHNLHFTTSVLALISTLVILKTYLHHLHMGPFVYVHIV
jgi:hypothetical protein